VEENKDFFFQPDDCEGLDKGTGREIRAKPGDQVFRPNRIEQFGVQVEISLNLPDIKGSSGWANALLQG